MLVGTPFYSEENAFYQGNALFVYLFSFLLQCDDIAKNHSNLVNGTGGSVLSGDTVEVTCDSGYVAKPNVRNITCMGSGVAGVVGWSDFECLLPCTYGYKK